MSDLVIPFDFNQHAVRVIGADPFNPKFVAKDVAVALGYKDSINAIKQHCKEVVKRHPVKTRSGIQYMNVINEPDLYRLIFGSKLQSAVYFQDWVFGVVLPAIRKTGKFSASEPVLHHPRLRPLSPNPRDKYITPAMQAHLQEAVSSVVKASRGFTSFQAVWKKLNQKMGVARYQDILKMDYPSACRFLGVKAKPMSIEAVKYEPPKPFEGVQDGCYMVEVKREDVVFMDPFDGCTVVDKEFMSRAMNNLKVISEQVALAMAVPDRFLKR